MIQLDFHTFVKSQNEALCETLTRWENQLYGCRFGCRLFDFAIGMMDTLLIFELRRSFRLGPGIGRKLELKFGTVNRSDVCIPASVDWWPSVPSRACEGHHWSLAALYRGAPPEAPAGWLSSLKMRSSLVCGRLVAWGMVRNGIITKLNSHEWKLLNAKKSIHKLMVECYFMCHNSPRMWNASR